MVFSTEACEDRGGEVGTQASAWSLAEACWLGPGTYLEGEDIALWRGAGLMALRWWVSGVFASTAENGRQLRCAAVSYPAAPALAQPRLRAEPQELAPWLVIPAL